MKHYIASAPYHIRQARAVSGFSKDPSTKVGAVITTQDGEQLVTGYNRFPEGHPDDPALYEDREYKYAHIVHAEVDALNNLRVVDYTSRGFVVYTSFPCCPDCVRAIHKAGAKAMFFPPIDTTGRKPQWISEWSQRVIESLAIADELGLEWGFVDV